MKTEGREDVEQALKNWGRFTPVIDAQSVDLGHSR